MLKIYNKFFVTISIIIIVCIAYYTLRWNLSQDNYFRADDWSWLFLAEEFKISEIFSLFPSTIYNDRPMGAILINVLYEIFGLNSVAFYALWLFIHTINTFLLFLIARNIFITKELALLTAILFGSYVVGLNAATWIAAVFDLLCNTFLLGSFYLYLKGDKRYNIIFSVVLYVLAIRTKEMAIFFPVILMSYDLLRTRSFNKFMLKELIKKQLFHYLAMFIYGVCYIYLFIQAPQTIKAPHDPYYQSVTFKDFIEGVSFYLNKLLYLNSSNYLPSFILVCILLLLLLFKRKDVLFGFFGFIISLLPVIFLKNHKDELYLYIPLVFYCILLVNLYESIISILIQKISKESTKKHVRHILISFGIVASIFFAFNINNSGFTKNRINFTLHYTKIYRENMHFIKQNFPSVPRNSIFFISGLPQYFNVFDYGPGNSLKLLYKDETIKVIIYKQYHELHEEYQLWNGPKFFLEYKDGILTNKSF